MNKLLTNPVFSRLGLKANITRISTDCYDELRLNVKTYLKKILEKAISIAKADKHKSLSLKYILNAIEEVGYTKHYQIDNIFNVCKISVHETVDKKIKDYQSQTDCYFFTKEGFFRFVKQLLTEIEPDKEPAKLDAACKLNLQNHIENYVVFKLFKDLNAIFAHAGRNTLKVADIETYSKIQEVLDA